ncbi:uncharacterized protein LOC134194239 [Corticium candelabrum]|uniref:uncharacterized protein LOC134194239 n=2 Tax=Corticium candelabrum TaxID=121492 RepID=UPI002E254325|nr:uncharacterized protein LOC134194239 [Corticium candelabrum]
MSESGSGCVESDTEEDDPPDCRRSTQSPNSCCPLCSLVTRDTVSLFQHINANHICYRNFPDVQFLEFHNRRLCSECGFAYGNRFSFCRRSLGPGRGRCRGLMTHPSASSWLSQCESTAVNGDIGIQNSPEVAPTSASRITSSSVPVSSSSNLVLEGIKAASMMSYPAVGDMELSVFNSLMNEVVTTPVQTVTHVPKSVRPLLSVVLAKELRCACEGGLWGFARLFMLAKATLRCPPRGGRKKRYVVKEILSSRLQRWLDGDILSLWLDVKAETNPCHVSLNSSNTATTNTRRSLRLASEGRYSDALQALGSRGCASHDSSEALEELANRHPVHDLPAWLEEVPPSLVVDSQEVISALEAFPNGSSPGYSHLRAQHLIDAIRGCNVPEAQSCLENLTRLMCLLLSGRLDRNISPFLSGAPLTALQKKAGGIRPIAVGEVLRRLASRLCCSAIKPRLPDVFLPYGQVGVGIRGGLEASVHSLRSYIEENSARHDLCCFKLDMKNAFNECHRNSFLKRLGSEFPELVAWVQWCYHCAAELRFGYHHLTSTAGVQQGDPLGPLLFSLVVLELMDEVGEVPGLDLNLWYLDDGTFAGTRKSVSKLINFIIEKGPSLGLHVNLSKCEVFWPSGDRTHPEFPPEVHRLSDGMELLGSPVFGSSDFFTNCFKKRVDQVANTQSHLSDLENPQVELQLLRSCLSICKINHLLRSVRPGVATSTLSIFDEGLRRSLSRITRSSISDFAWSQAVLPIGKGGMGIREALSTSPSAFLGSCNSNRKLVNCLLKRNHPSLLTLIKPLPGEDEARGIVHNLLSRKDSPSLDLVTATQHQIQIQLDDISFSNLLNSVSLRDRARLKTLSSPHTGAWLRATPNRNLGLTMSPHEFVVAARYWLGLPVFPFPPNSIRCICGHPLDPYGDHLVGCGHGPHRLNRHNALCESIWQSLLIDSKQVVKEQRSSGQSKCRPGDVFHPNFLNGRPGYFDITVRNTLQPSYIARVAETSGVVAEAAEMGKDDRHHARVSLTGGTFYPLVVETLGLWSPDSLETLKSISSKVCAVLAVPFWKALKNLLEQLSVRLWIYNARMISSRILAEVAEVLSWDFPVCE